MLLGWLRGNYGSFCLLIVCIYILYLRRHFIPLNFTIFSYDSITLDHNIEHSFCAGFSLLKTKDRAFLHLDSSLQIVGKGALAFGVTLTSSSASLDAFIKQCLLLYLSHSLSMVRITTKKTRAYAQGLMILSIRRHAVSDF